MSCEVGLSLRVAHAEPEMGAEEAVLYVYTSLAAFLVMYPAWWLVNRNVEAPTAERTPGARSKEPVKAGLLMSIFWSGAIFAAELAKIANSLLRLGTLRSFSNAMTYKVRLSKPL